MRSRKKNFYRRTLPHWHPHGAAIFLTWRLYGSLPRSAIERLSATRELLERELARNGETHEERVVKHAKMLFKKQDDLLDSTTEGSLWLKDPEVADIVEAALLHRHNQLYKLWSYVVMPNHVHAFLQAKRSEAQDEEFVAIEKITKGLKGYTAREANRFLGRTGESFWQDESYDHWARDEGEFSRIVAYIENNPVKAGLAARPQDWKWSSASERVRRCLSDFQALT